MTPALEKEMRRLAELGGASFKMDPRLSGQAKQLGYVVYRDTKWTLTEMGRAALRAQSTRKGN